MDILEYKAKFNFQNRDWNKTIVDKLKELRQVALMAFKSQDNMTEMPGKEPGKDAFKKWTAKLHRALKPILWEVCSNTYTMFKIEHPDHGNGVRDFKWKCGMTRMPNATKTPKENPQPSKTPRLTVKNRRRRDQRKAKKRKKI